MAEHQRGGRRRSRSSREVRLGGWGPTAGLLIAFVALTAAVAAGLADRLDAHLLEVFRPGGTWGRTQQVAQRVESLAPPERLAAALVVTAVLSALCRRRAWPLLVAATAGLSAGGLCLLVKLALARTDPNGRLTEPGSYPSGHTLTAVVCAGLFWLLVLPHARRTGLPRWAAGLTALAGVVMATCLLLEGVHWASDVVGGGLLGAAVLAATSRVLAGPPARETDPLSAAARRRAAPPPRRRAPEPR